MNYKTCLDVAITAALKAGEHLLSDFNREGGPRGHGDHAPADNEAEAIIRQCLNDAFPDFGQLGEELPELDRPSLNEQQHVWAIDPNDGTQAFLKGWRGSAVSIGLLCRGVPVLGVVYAYAERAGLGDLIAWAEGQPLTRNGSIINPDDTASAIGPKVILLSQNADNIPRVNATLCHPYRFRTVPSIAYRLALVAVGEGVAGISLAGPTNWDVVAGHALLRASNMELYRFNGQPVRYRADGYGDVGDCMGGKAEMVEHWVKQDWDNVFDQPTNKKSVRFPLVRPNAKQIFTDTERLNRGQGCLAGLLMGDNLGARVEFQSAAQIARNNPDGFEYLEDGGCWNILAGQPTDDGELALMLGRSIVSAKGYDPECAASAYLYWYNSGPFDIGNTTGGVLSRVSNSGRDQDIAKSCRLAASKFVQSQANGGLMRVAPLAIWGHALDNQTLADLARQDAMLTHQNSICQDANTVFCIAIAEGIRGADAQTVYEKTLNWSRSSTIQPEVLVSLEAAEKAAPKDYDTHMGWVLIALQNAFYQLLHADDASIGIKASTLAGGDTDTNAAIAGALLGSVYGVNSMPRQWLQALVSARPLIEYKSKQLRPESFWPVDCLILAEQLLWLGASLGSKN